MNLFQGSRINRGIYLSRLSYQFKLVLICFFLILKCQAQTSLPLSQSFVKDSLSNWFDLKAQIYFAKNLQIESLDEIIAAKDLSWKNLNSAQNTYWKSDCWLRFSLDNQSNKDLDLVLLLHGDDISFWMQDEKGNWEEKEGGNLKARSRWDSQTHIPVYSSPHSFQFSIPEQEKREIYLRLGPQDQYFSLDPLLASRDFFLELSTPYFNRTIATQAFFHGILWIMLLYHLVMFFMYRDRAYAYYSGYIFAISLSLFFIFGTHYLTSWAEYPKLNRLLQIAALYGFLIFYALFLKSFLHADGWRPDLKRLHLRFSKPMYLFAGLNFILLFLPPTLFKLNYSYWLLLPIAILGLVGFLRLNFKYWKSGNKLARYIVLSNSLLFIGLFLSNLSFYLGALPWLNQRILGFAGVIILEFSIICQLISFALCLSYKGLMTEREKTKLEELDHLKSRFFANISHEFRTPLTLILGPVRQLKAIVNDKKERSQLKIIENYAQKLLHMVNQILDLSRLEAGKLSLEATVFDLIERVRLITFSFESIANEAEIKLSFEANAEKLPVYLDLEKIDQILINLLANAIKYNREKGYVKVELEHIPNKKVNIKVMDNGIGISPEAQAHIFHLYYQGKQKGFASEMASSGIGLAYCKELVELMGGQISVNSAEGQGATFTFQLPLVPIPTGALEQNLVPIISDQQAESKVEDLSKDSTEKALVLIVEDHRDIQSYIQSCLSPKYDLLIASDGKAGLKIAQEKVPDLILTDVMMPKMDGYELSEKLKVHPVTSHIPILMLTGKSSKASRLEGLKRQVDDYLTKPFDAEELLIRIQNLLDNRQKWVAYYQQQIGKNLALDQKPSLDQLWLSEAETAVRENLGDENFGVEQLGKVLLLDRTQLFRKLKALTGENPSYFIRTIRLEEAYKLLEQKSASISEIAFQVGFANTSYFNRSFKKHFNKTPGEVFNSN